MATDANSVTVASQLITTQGSHAAFRKLVATTVVCCLTWATAPLIAQDAQRWEADIQKFEQADAQSAPEAGGVLFVGSSSIRMWKLDESFPNRNAINRGFGGSQISDTNHFFDRIVAPYKPSTIVVYAGDNDIAAGESMEQVVSDYRTFLALVTEKLPKAHVVYLPIKPSLSRWNLWDKMNATNETIKVSLLPKSYRWHYLDLPALMMNDQGEPNPDLFLDDGLHLNAQGYAIWNAALESLLNEIDATSNDEARGVVYEDRNHNQQFDPQDLSLPNVRVSNGRDIVVTDDEGRYTLPIDQDDTIFVIKPRGYRTPLNEDQLPQFYYTHKPHGSPQSRYPGVRPTGPLPESIDFPLYPQEEPKTFQAIFFGDPQPRNQEEVDYVAHDVVEELIGTQAAFGVTLGDITFDNLDLFEKQNQAIALLGIPWYNVIGNHDVNYDATSDELSDETFERVYGPNYYSFNYGPTHFIVLDDIEFYIDEEKGKPGYRGGLGADQIRFVREDLATVPNDQLVVLMMHIPIVGIHDREPLYRLLEPRRFCMSISGHTHHHEHRFLTRKDGWRGVEPHHHLINVTVSGSWWGGAPDDRGIPHTMMADGAPNGYSIISFDGSDYRVDFKAAGRPADYQMRIMVPNEVSLDQLDSVNLMVNVFNGSERSKVEARFGVPDGDDENQWTEMKRSVENDPHYQALAEQQNNVENKTWRNLPGPKPSPHLWKLALQDLIASSETPSGVHMLQIRVTDENDRVYEAGRVVRLRANPGK